MQLLLALELLPFKVRNLGLEGVDLIDECSLGFGEVSLNEFLMRSESVKECELVLHQLGVRLNLSCFPLLLLYLAYQFLRPLLSLLHFLTKLDKLPLDLDSLLLLKAFIDVLLLHFS